MTARKLDLADEPNAQATLDLALRYLHDMAVVRLGSLRTLDKLSVGEIWTPRHVRMVIEREIALMDFLTLLGADDIAQAVVTYHTERNVDFPRPMGVKND